MLLQNSVTFGRTDSVTSVTNSTSEKMSMDSFSLEDLGIGAGIAGGSPFSRRGNVLTHGSSVPVSALIPGCTYAINLDMKGLSYIEDTELRIPTHLYAMEEAFVERAMRRWSKSTDLHTGILLNGLKGTGKTVTAKMIARASNLPIILVDRKLDILGMILDGIRQDVVVYIDEFEKIYDGVKGDALAALLTMLDGKNNGFKRLFILTSNDNNVNTNLDSRPGRILYVKNFPELSTDVIANIVTDRLNNKELIPPVLDILARVDKISIDIVTSFVDEVNVQEGFLTPQECLADFNVAMASTKFNVFVTETTITPDGPVFGKRQLHTIAKSNEIYNYGSYSDANMGYRLMIKSESLGTITQILEPNKIMVRDSVSINVERASLPEDMRGEITDPDDEYDVKFTQVTNTKYAMYEFILSHETWESRVNPYGKNILDDSKLL